MLDFEFVRGTAGANAHCGICGQAYALGGIHGSETCAKSKETTLRYLGVTPEQMRQIVREEIRAALGKPE
jgi:hypothetical protein